MDNEDKTFHVGERIGITHKNKTFINIITDEFPQEDSGKVIFYDVDTGHYTCELDVADKKLISCRALMATLCERRRQHLRSKLSISVDYAAEMAFEICRRDTPNFDEVEITDEQQEIFRIGDEIRVEYDEDICFYCICGGVPAERVILYDARTGHLACEFSPSDRLDISLRDLEDALFAAGETTKLSVKMFRRSTGHRGKYESWYARGIG